VGNKTRTRRPVTHVKRDEQGYVKRGLNIWQQMMRKLKKNHPEYVAVL
jgi:hypothetical protein